MNFWKKLFGIRESPISKHIELPTTKRIERKLSERLENSASPQHPTVPKVNPVAKGDCPKCQTTNTIEHNGGKWCPHCGEFITPPKQAVLSTNSVITHNLANSYIQAAQQFDLEKLENLTKVNPDLPDLAKELATLLNAVAHGDLEKVALLVKGKPSFVFYKDEDGFTLLHGAAFEGHKVIVELLLVSGAEVDAKTEDQATPLHMSAAGGHSNVVELLLANKAKTDVKDKIGQTPLHIAAIADKIDVVKLLLAAKADVNANDNDGWTPLRAAMSKGNKDIVEFLRQHGGLMSVKTEDTAAHLLSPGLIRYRGLTFGIDGEYSLVCDDKKIVRGIWYRHREDIKNAARNRMVAATASVNGFTVLDSDYQTTIVGGIGGVEELNNPGGAILWFDSTRELFGK